MCAPVCVYACMCVCLCLFVRACVRACVRVCVCLCVLTAVIYVYYYQSVKFIDLFVASACFFKPQSSFMPLFTVVIVINLSLPTCFYLYYVLVFVFKKTPT